MTQYVKATVTYRVVRKGPMTLAMTETKTRTTARTARMTLINLDVSAPETTPSVTTRQISLRKPRTQVRRVYSLHGHDVTLLLLLELHFSEL